jgi:hypothetical protein
MQAIAVYFLQDLYDDHNCRSGTLRGYAEAINSLHLSRGFQIPAELKNPKNASAIFIKQIKDEEVIARQREPLTIEIFVMLKQLADENPDDSEFQVVFEWFCLIKILGLRGGEYAQNTQTKIEKHVYPSGTSVTKAFIRLDWIFYDHDGKKITDDHDGKKITDHGIHNLNRVAKVKVIFRIQKNRQNGQKITVTYEVDAVDICPVRAAYKIYLRSIRLDQSDDEPMAVFKNKHGYVKYLTLSKIEEVLRKAARRAHPDWSDDEVNRLSSHSGRVWALVLLTESGKDGAFACKRLRWMGDSYKLYLRDTSVINKQHSSAMKRVNGQVLALLGSNVHIIPSEQEEDIQMGTYLDPES